MTDDEAVQALKGLLNISSKQEKRHRSKRDRVSECYRRRKHSSNGRKSAGDIDDDDDDDDVDDVDDDDDDDDDDNDGNANKSTFSMFAFL